MRGRELAAVGISVLLTGTGVLAATGRDDAGAADASRGEHRARALTVEMRDVTGERVGVVRLEERWGSVRVDARFWSLAEGFHGFHVHAVGACAAEPGGGPFTAAGGHYARAGQDHGEHAGDLPSLLVEADGRARLTFTTDRFSLADLRDGDGSAVMVHEGRDNFANIPERYRAGGADDETERTGDSGARVACGAIRPRRS